MLTGNEPFPEGFATWRHCALKAMRHFCFTLLSRRAVDAPQLNRKETIFGGFSTIYLVRLGLMVRVRAMVRVWVRVRVMSRSITVLEYCLGLPTYPQLVGLGPLIDRPYSVKFKLLSQ